MEEKKIEECHQCKCWLHMGFGRGWCWKLQDYRAADQDPCDHPGFNPKEDMLR